MDNPTNLVFLIWFLSQIDQVWLTKSEVWNVLQKV